ncbi:universal stress protein [Mucilaginibacter sp.]|uniref:universal stress protein n=1 Tax=Mucilaginibacter sp. TaxID=1882438 RepID=UPI002600DA50|nr:universal stress protein [Mucilaginibacter sp.]
MKRILLLTDFSENAAHAARSVVMLGEKLHADLLLLHNIAGIPVTPYHIGGGFVAEETSWQMDESRGHLLELTEQLEIMIGKLGSMSYNPVVHRQIAEGSLGENILTVVKQQQIEMIVMGGRSGSAFDHLWFGNDTRSVIEQAGCPVMVIPQEHDLGTIKKVVFATDFNAGDMKAVKYLVKLGELFDFQLEIVHVSQFGKQEGADDQKKLSFVSQVYKLNYPKIIYKDIRGKDFLARVDRLCGETGADLLALVHYPHSFFSRLLQGSHTMKALSRPHIPVLVFPGKN